MEKISEYKHIHLLEKDKSGKLVDSKCDKCGKPIDLLDRGIIGVVNGKERYYHEQCKR